LPTSSSIVCVAPGSGGGVSDAVALAVGLGVGCAVLLGAALGVMRYLRVAPCTGRGKGRDSDNVAGGSINSSADSQSVPLVADTEAPGGASE
jgi:hypothetical protein